MQEKTLPFVSINNCQRTFLPSRSFAFWDSANAIKYLTYFISIYQKIRKKPICIIKYTNVGTQKILKTGREYRISMIERGKLRGVISFACGRVFKIIQPTVPKVKIHDQAHRKEIRKLEKFSDLRIMDISRPVLHIKNVCKKLLKPFVYYFIMITEYVIVDAKDE